MTVTMRNADSYRHRTDFEYEYEYEYDDQSHGEQAAPVNAPMAVWFQVWHSCRRVTEQRRSTSEN